MSKGRDRTIYRTPDGWANKRNDADRASGVHQKQREAVKEAADMLRRQGGGELTIIGRDNRIRSKDTIAPAVPPYAS